MTEQHDAYAAARKRVEARFGFYIHAAVFVAVNAGLIVLNFMTKPDDLWFYWVLGGWGAGLALHAFRVFGGNGTSLTEKMLDRATQRELQRRQGGSGTA